MDVSFPTEANGASGVVDFDTAAPALTGRRKKMTKKPKTGGFESMDLLPELYRAIKLKGYQLPTPVQRKTLPLALAGHDVVAMARTGSGKTAAFLVPMLQRLRARSTTGVRGLVLSPSRELAMQTFKFAKELNKYLTLRMAVVVGGDTLEAQFDQLATNPDILIATPGRLMHHLQEIEGFRLQAVQVVVFDEADRLFEMGFAEQLRAILREVPDSRQTMLVSATMPSVLAEFARAGLQEPQVVRLDTETRISPDLATSFLLVRMEEKVGALLYLLKEVVGVDEQTIVFASTRHHVSFLGQLLQADGLKCSLVYGEMDQTARNISVAKFGARKSKVLIVTDVAARGIDIPLLDNVINFDFPARAKLFVHRVGRAARAGRSGVAFSLLTRDELGYLVDLSLFLGEKLVCADMDGHAPARPRTLGCGGGDGGQPMVLGSFPQALLDTVIEKARMLEAESADLTALTKVCRNAFKQYLRTRPGASSESQRRAGDLPPAGPHPVLVASTPAHLKAAKGFAAMAAQLRSFRPTHTILEAEVAGARGGGAGGGAAVKGVKANTKGALVMTAKRQLHSKAIMSRVAEAENRAAAARAKALTLAHQQGEEVGDGDASACKLVRRRHAVAADLAGTAAFGRFRDPAFFVQATPSLRSAERDMSVHGAAAGLDDSVLDLLPEDAEGIKQSRSVVTWDKRKMAYVRHMGGDVRTRGEKRPLQVSKDDPKFKSKAMPGALYKQWQRKTHKSIGDNKDDKGEGQFDTGFVDEDKAPAASGGPRRGRGRWRDTPKAKERPGATRELKGADQIRKERLQKAKAAERLRETSGGARGGGGAKGGKGSSNGGGKGGLKGATSSLGGKRKRFDDAGGRGGGGGFGSGRGDRKRARADSSGLGGGRGGGRGGGAGGRGGGGGGRSGGGRGGGRGGGGRR